MNLGPVHQGESFLVEIFLLGVHIILKAFTVSQGRHGTPHTQEEAGLAVAVGYLEGVEYFLGDV